MLMDIRITEYLIGLFYILRMPTSHYVIRRYFHTFVLIEADIFLFGYRRLVYFVDLRYWFLYTVAKLRKWISYEFLNASHNRFVQDVLLHKRLLSRRLSYVSIYTMTQACKAPLIRVYNKRQRRRNSVIKTLLLRHVYNANRLMYNVQYRYFMLLVHPLLRYHIKKHS